MVDRCAWRLVSDPNYLGDMFPLPHGGMSRRLVFISHVNERVDNAFAEWLALKLTAAGYSSWCDRTELVAGDHHWTKIQEALDEAAVFVYVLSDASNKSGPVRGSVNELEHAIEIQREEGIEGFIVRSRLDR